MNEELRRSSAHVFVSSIDAPELEFDDAHHLLRVMRLRDGEVVSVTDGADGWRLCRIGADGALRPEGDVHRAPAPSPMITIGVALPKGDRPEWIVQKLTEIGVDRILLLHTERSVVRWDAAKAAKHLERLGRVAREAAMQSRRVRAIELVGPLAFAAVVTSTSGSGSGSVSAAGHGSSGSLTVVGGIALAEPGGGDVGLDAPTVLIGPEGGWSDSERDLVPTHVSLGSNVLRVETAALSAAVRLAALRDR